MNAVTLTESRALFDAHGRRMPTRLRGAAHQSVRRRFICAQPTIDYAAIHDRITRHLNCPGAISAAAFQQRAEAILQGLRETGVTNAVGVPFLLPPTPDATTQDMGTLLDDIYLPAVTQSFEETLPSYNMVNHHKSGLAGKLRVAPGSRHQRLLKQMETGVVVGYLFVSLTEYSRPAALEQMDELPEQFLLAGGIDLCAALVGSPDLLLRTDGYPPLIWLAALDAESDVAGYHFEAYGYNLNFNRRVHFNEAAEYWASALVVLG